MKSLIKFSIFKLKGSTGPYFTFNHNVDNVYTHKREYHIGVLKSEERMAEDIRSVIDRVVKELNISEEDIVPPSKMPEIKLEFSEERFMKAVLVREKVVDKRVFLKFEEKDYVFFEKVLEYL